jgi:hypothetical protein
MMDTEKQILTVIVEEILAITAGAKVITFLKGILLIRGRL